MEPSVNRGGGLPLLVPGDSDDDVVQQFRIALGEAEVRRVKQLGEILLDERRHGLLPTGRGPAAASVHDAGTL